MAKVGSMFSADWKAFDASLYSKTCRSSSPRRKAVCASGDCVEVGKVAAPRPGMVCVAAGWAARICVLLTMKGLEKIKMRQKSPLNFFIDIPRLGGAPIVLPRDIHAFLDPLRVADLLHHEVSYISARDAAAVPRKGIAIDTKGAPGPGVG